MSDGHAMDMGDDPAGEGVGKSTRGERAIRASRTSVSR